MSVQWSRHTPTPCGGLMGRSASSWLSVLRQFRQRMSSCVRRSPTRLITWPHQSFACRQFRQLLPLSDDTTRSGRTFSNLKQPLSLCFPRHIIILPALFVFVACLCSGRKIVCSLSSVASRLRHNHSHACICTSNKAKVSCSASCMQSAACKRHSCRTHIPLVPNIVWAPDNVA